MALLKIDADEVLLVRYCGESVSDPDALRKELVAEAASGRERDTIIEFANSTMIFSSEIGAVVQFLKTIQSTDRTLHLVASPYVCEMLTTMNISKIPRIVLHDHFESVQGRFPNVDFSARFD